jgi:hypothetical protein
MDGWMDVDNNGQYGDLGTVWTTMVHFPSWEGAFLSTTTVSRPALEPTRPPI